MTNEYKKINQFSRRGLVFLLIPQTSSGVMFRVMSKHWGIFYL
jgi:hypothetical protein